MARLVVTGGRKQGEFHVIMPEGMSIGRLPTSGLCLVDERVSRQHARIERREDGWHVIDLGSMNGTKVNGVAVADHLLVSGDRLSIGTHSLLFEDEATAQVVVAEGRPLVPGDGTVVKSLAQISALMKPGVVSGPAALEKSNNTLRTLYEVGKALLSTSGLSGLLNLIMDQVFKALPAQRGFLLLIDPRTGELMPSVVRTNEPGYEGGVTISRTITDAVIKDRVSVLTGDAATDPRFQSGESVIMFGIRSALCAPLWSDEDIIGVIYIDTRNDAYSFTEDDLDLLTAMANQAAIGILNARLAEKARREAEQRNRLARYHSPAVVEHILRECEDEAELLAASEKEVTVLFSDIKGFTSISEKLTPTEVSELLNEYFTKMTDIVFEFGGSLDKYIGDAVMALFGAPFAGEEDAVNAVRAAVKMQAVLNKKPAGLEGLSVRIGINTGVVVAGNIGSPRRMDYTVIGDAVNVAQRLESIAKPGQVLIGGSTYERVKDRFLLNEIGRQHVKGKDEEVVIYEVLG
ncbi:MAG TPA: adenylate/guanylate cyclase domain-containing protein [Nitrospirota bacterium]